MSANDICNSLLDFDGDLDQCLDPGIALKSNIESLVPWQGYVLCE